MYYIICVANRIVYSCTERCSLLCASKIKMLSKIVRLESHRQQVKTVIIILINIT